MPDNLTGATESGAAWSYLAELAETCPGCPICWPLDEVEDWLTDMAGRLG